MKARHLKKRLNEVQLSAEQSRTLEANHAKSHPQVLLAGLAFVSVWSFVDGTRTSEAEVYYPGVHAMAWQLKPRAFRFAALRPTNSVWSPFEAMADIVSRTGHGRYSRIRFGDNVETFSSPTLLRMQQRPVMFEQPAPSIHRPLDCAADRARATH